MNYVNGLQQKMVPAEGRGLFATRDLKKGELLIAEKALAVGKGKHQVNDLVDNCIELSKLKGVHALRLNALWNGDKDDLKVSGLGIFVKNNYRQYKIPDIPVKKIE